MTNALPKLLAAAAGTLFAANTHAADDVTVFARYAGTWKAEMTHLQTPYSKPSNESMTIENDCWHSHVFYVCDQIIDGAPKALIVFFYNAEEKRYGSFPITAHSDNLHPGDVHVEGKTIIFPWQINDNGRGVYMRIVNVFKTPDLMEFRQEYSNDDANWNVMIKGTQQRVSAPGKKAK